MEAEIWNLCQMTEYIHFLQEIYVCFFPSSADVSTAVQSCFNPIEHVVFFYLYGLCNPNVQCFNAVWWRGIIARMTKLHNQKSMEFKSGDLGG